MQQNSSKNYLIPTLIIGVLFFVFGFITWVNSTLIPYLQTACELTPNQAILVTFASYIAYAVMAFPSAGILKYTGFKKGMMLGLGIMALGALLFIPAANSRTFGMFLTGLFVMGIGMALLQTAANPYITILGPIESAAKRMSVMGICNKGAGAIAPMIMGALLLNGMDAYSSDNLSHLALDQKNALLDQLAGKIIGPYIFIAVVFIILAIAIYFSSLPDIKNEDETNPDHQTKDRSSIFNYPYLWLGFATLFLYVGVEVIAGDTIQLYGNTGLHIPIEQAKHFTSFTMICMLVGYLAGIVLIPKYINQSTALKISAILGLIFSFGVIFLPGYYSIASLALLGLANAPMWPSIWPLTIDGLGKFLKTGSALLIVGIAGGAILPKIWTMISSYTGMQSAFWILIPCYLFILFFAIKGHKVGKTVNMK
ncbi:glucose/galactose transporter [Arachidicoccus rhizosphaerae]|uniref:Glucose/galactose transporter n=1 Tax=Arachidicoccus rhizosphaerae TaxID=551991 RepID=A0A1H3WMS3_9BACT|nr:sugar MFS transporter [Arachidicoccus rhizosphaerae]SDZ87652.1 glucose/galactose transporter [Arachidicoccus rhizosphaerae]